MKPLLGSTNIAVRDDNMFLHNHACAELYVSLDGYAVNNINGFESETLPLDVFVLTERMKHSQPVTNKYRFCLFKFDMELLIQKAGVLTADATFQMLFVSEPKMRENGQTSSGLQIDLLTSEYALKTAQLLERETDPELRDTLFFTLVSVICKNARPRTIGGNASNYERIFSTASYMEMHYARPLELQELAEHAQYSVRHFTRIFRHCYHISPMDYLNQIRLRHAILLLQDSGLSMGRISELCGFTDQCMFSKVFRKQFGQTPSEYRKMLLSSSATSRSALENAEVIGVRR